VAVRNNEWESDPNSAVPRKSENEESVNESDDGNADQAEDSGEDSEEDSDHGGEEDLEAISEENSSEESQLSDEVNNEDKPITNVEGLRRLYLHKCSLFNYTFLKQG